MFLAWSHFFHVFQCICKVEDFLKLLFLLFSFIPRRLLPTRCSLLLESVKLRNCCNRSDYLRTRWIMEAPALLPERSRLPTYGSWRRCDLPLG